MATRFVALAVLGALLLAACSGGGEPQAAPSPTRTITASPSPTPSPSPSPSPTGPVAPLTGVVAAGEDLADRPVLAVKIENTAAARPQSGLADADLVYEELVEGGVTRFIALFHSRVPEVVGPVRSGRLVDVEVLPPYDALFALSGARQQVIAALRNAGISLLVDTGTGVPFYRESSRPAPHNLYSTGEALYKAGASRDLEPPTRVFTFDEDVPDGAVTCSPAPCDAPGTEITIRMSRSARTGWDYDPTAGLYRRSQNGVPFEVAGDGEIGAANVVVLGMSVGAGVCCDPAGSPLVHTQVTGSGRAIVLRDGAWYEARWRKRSAASHLELFLDDEPFPLKPGPTWIHLAPAENLPPVP